MLLLKKKELMFTQSFFGIPVYFLLISDGNYKKSSGIFYLTSSAMEILSTHAVVVFPVHVRSHKADKILQKLKNCFMFLLEM